ncbi:MAG: response regulator transcription factor [Bacteroidetes bacterium]|nr:response regulator transcription factor [Bacteroidota bacterium]
MDIKPKKILIADDEPDIREIIEYNLAKEGYEVILAKDGNEAIDLARKEKPDMMILDIMMPFKTGLEACQIIRTNPNLDDMLILFLTAIDDETSHINALEYGGDDYISKPIGAKLLVSRVNALFRRMNKEDASTVLYLDDMTIDPIRFVVEKNGEEIKLAKKEFELLYMLTSHPGRVFLRNEILSKIWGNDIIVGDRTIDVHIRKIRQKLNTDRITTVKGVGYKFEK